MIVWRVKPFSTLFQLYIDRQCTFLCLPPVLFNDTPQNSLVKPLAGSPHNHRQNNGQQSERINPVAMTLINPLKEHSSSGGSNQRSHVLKSCTLANVLYICSNQCCDLLSNRKSWGNIDYKIYK